MKKLKYLKKPIYIQTVLALIIKTNKKDSVASTNIYKEKLHKLALQYETNEG